MNLKIIATNREDRRNIGVSIKRLKKSIQKPLFVQFNGLSMNQTSHTCLQIFKYSCKHESV